jgi:hydrogenase-4 membrane subunit HyfE
VSQQCHHHPATAAAAPCAGCADPFCEDCLVNVSGQTYCESCKAQAVAGLPVPGPGTIPCAEATQALWIALIGVIVLGPVLEPLALVRASQARKRIVQDTHLTGDARAAAAVAIAIASLVIWGIVIATHVVSAMRSG